MPNALWRLTQVSAAAHEAAQRGLGMAAEHVLTASQAQVPVLEGTLRASGVASQDGDTAAVSYNTPYAVRQHEELGYRHPRGGKAKYLEDPLTEEAKTVSAIISTEVKRAFQ